MILAKALLKSVHCTTDKDTSLGPSFIFNDITFSDEIPKPKHCVPNIFFSNCRIKCFATYEISAQVSFFPLVKNETFS